MKNTQDTRRVAELYHTDARRTQTHVVLTFHGISAKKRRRTRLIVPVPWDFLPYIMRDIKKQWNEERARRVCELGAVDNALPKE